METREPGSTGLALSIFGLGTMTFGAESDETTSHAVLDHYHASGGRFIDTADVYNRGVSEEIIGRWLARTNADLVIATKARFPMGDGADQRGAGREYLERALEASLRRLGVETIDLYQMHAWDPLVPIEETLGALSGFVESGKIRFLGVSNYTGWQTERAAQVARHHGWAPIATMQPQYSLLAREIELEVVPPCIENGIGLLPWSPLGGGWLTGKYSSAARPTGATRLGTDPNRGVEAYDLRNNQKTWDVIEVVESVAGERGVPMSAVALNWVRHRPGVTSVLLGCRSVEQLEENLRALDWDLEPDEMTALNEVSAPGVPTYPYGFLEKLAGVDVWSRLETRVTPAF